MILQSLYQLYDRLAADEKYQLPVPGYSLQKISLEIVLRPDGGLHQLADIRQPAYKKNSKGETVQTNKLISRNLLVLGAAKPSGSGINPCFLWDNPLYVLGFGDREAVRTRACFEAFREKHLSLEKEINCQGYSAVCRFLETWNPDEISEENASVLSNLGTGFVVFRILGERQYVHEMSEIKKWWNQKQEKEESAAEEGQVCLVSGKKARIAMTHDPAIKNVVGAQSSGAKIVTFNCKSFESYAKSQGENAPVSEDAAFRYCNALNTLLISEDHHFRLGDTTIVFWSEKPNPVEDVCSRLFQDDLDEEEEEQKTSEQDDKKLREVKAFWKAVRQGGEGSITQEDKDCPFYILGLSPNVSRLAIRFWMVSTAGKILENLIHFRQELEIVRSPNDKMSYTIKNILRQTARETKDISLLLEGSLMRTVLTGAPYPASLITQILSRLRIDGNKNSLRAAILKAFLSRNHNQKLTMGLDKDNTDTAYVLGRLFATLEKVQYEGMGSVNASIGDKYYGAAASTPGIVFSRLIESSKHHLRKMPKKKSDYWHAYIGEVMDILKVKTGFPAHLTLQEQAMFALGYYQQRQFFFIPKEQRD